MASGVNLFVVPLDKAVDDAILKNAFGKYGELFSAQVARDEKGLSKGYGFVNFCSINDGLRAKEDMEGKTLLNRTIHVKFARKQEAQCNKDRGKRDAMGGGTMWASDWNLKSSDGRDEGESVYDLQSQYSYATTNDSNPAETPDIKERMRKLFESQSFTDVTFFPKNNRKQSISAHRAVLAVSSPLFTKMLFDDKNKVAVGEILEVQISNLSFDAFTCIVKYLYTDEVYFENDSLAQAVLQGAKEFGIASLVVQCKEYFLNVELSSENVCTKLQMSLSYKLNALKERCIEYIQSNTLSVIQTPDFQNCNSTTIRTICKLQSFNLRSELEVLEAVMQWLRAQPLHERKSHREVLLKSIRFLNLTVGEFGDALKKYTDMMTSDEGLSIMLFLYNTPKNPNFSSLPSWCNKNMNSRCFFKEEENLRASQTGLNVVDPNGIMVGKVLFPLKSDPGQGFASELTSLLHMKCISGFHQLRAIKLRFQKPMSDQCRINDLLIEVHVTPSNFDVSEKVQIVNSECVRVEFRRVIKIRRGDTVDIEAFAKNIKLYKFLQFDDACQMPTNPHFSISISSSPKQGKLYFISEIEYGPQDKFDYNFKNRRMRK